MVGYLTNKREVLISNHRMGGGTQKDKYSRVPSVRHFKKSKVVQNSVLDTVWGRRNGIKLKAIVIGPGRWGWWRLGTVRGLEDEGQEDGILLRRLCF
jgi:hypothetical protein